MRVRVLGPVAVAGDDGEIHELTSPSQRLVLALLAVQRGVVVDTDRLVEALWPGGGPPTAAHTLRTYVSRLRRRLGDDLAIRPGGYVLSCDADAVDLDRFARLVSDAAATRAEPAGAVADLDAALGLWRGPAFGDLGDHLQLRGSAVRLGELRLSAREARVRALRRCGRAAEAVGAAEELVAEAPLREGAWVALVEALHAATRPAEALRAVQRAAAALAEAGLEPSPALRAAEAAVLTGEAPAPAEPAPPAPARPRPGRARDLPVPSSSLVGRDAELDGLDALTGTARLVTLTGPGGVGKTRLALALAERARARHVGGARLVALSSLDDPTQVIAAIAGALGLAVDRPSALDVLALAGGLDVLVVLDNCEHVIDEAARAAAAIVKGGGRARVLATSRERLGIEGEHVWPVAPLEVAPPGSDAGRAMAAHLLFVERLRAVAPRRELSALDHDLIDRIALRLDGLPLAIEMAAARAAALPLPELADRLDDLDLLRTPRRDAEPRHRTLGAVVAWSEALLDEAQRGLLEDLSVFAGPVPATDVRAVTGRADALEVLLDLTERSLVVTDTSRPTARFGLLATVREHVSRRTAGRPRRRTLLGRHATHVAEAARDAAGRLQTEAEATAHHRFEELMDEARAAHRWARAHDLDLAVSLSASLHLFAQSRLRDEPESWAAALVAGLDAGAVTRLDHGDVAATFAAAAQHAVNQGRLDDALDLAERGLAAGGISRGAAMAGIMAADTLLFLGRLEECGAVAARVRELGEQVGDVHAVVEGSLNAAVAAAYAGNRERGLGLLAGIPLGDLRAPSDQAWLAYGEGEVVLDSDPGRALARLDDAAAVAREVGNRYVEGVARLSSCSLRARTGDLATAAAAFAAVIERWRRENLLPYQVTTLRNLVVVLQHLELAAEVAELVGCVTGESVRPTFGGEADLVAGAAEWAAGVLGPEIFARHHRRGAARSVDESAGEALRWLRTGR